MAIGSSTMMVNIVVRMRNEATREMQALNAEFDATNAHAMGFGSELAGALGGLSAFAVRVGLVGGIMTAFSAAAAVSFDKAKTEAASFTGVSTADINRLGDAYLQSAGKIGISANDMMKASYGLLSIHAGIAQTFGIVTQAAKIAVASGTQVDDVVGGMRAVLQEYGVTVGNQLTKQQALAAGIQGTTNAAGKHVVTMKDVSHVMDEVNRGVVSGTMHWAEFSRGIATALPVAAALHIPLGVVLGLLDELTKRGVTARAAMQAVNFTFKALETQGTTQIRTSKALGLAWQELYQKQGSMAVITILNLYKASQQHVLSERQVEQATGLHATRAKYLYEILSRGPNVLANLTRGTIALNTVLRAVGQDGGKDLIATILRIEQGTLTINSAFDIAKTHAYVAFEQIKQSMRSAAIEIGSVMLPAVSSLFQALGPAILAFATLAAHVPALTVAILGSLAAMLAFGLGLKAVLAVMALQQQASTGLRVALEALGLRERANAVELDIARLTQREYAASTDMMTAAVGRAAAMKARDEAVTAGNQAKVAALDVEIKRLTVSMAEQSAAMRESAVAAADYQLALGKQVASTREAQAATTAWGEAQRVQAEAVNVEQAAVAKLNTLLRQQSLTSSSLAISQRDLGVMQAKLDAQTAGLNATQRAAVVSSASYRKAEQDLAAQQQIVSNIEQVRVKRDADIVAQQQLVLASTKERTAADAELAASQVAVTDSNLAVQTSDLKVVEGGIAVVATQEAETVSSVNLALALQGVAGAAQKAVLGMIPLIAEFVAVNAPILLVIGAIALLVGAFVLAYNSVAGFRTLVQGALGALGTLFGSFAQKAVGALRLLGEVLGQIGGKVGAFLGQLGAQLGGVITVFGRMMGAIGQASAPTTQLATAEQRLQAVTAGLRGEQLRAAESSRAYMQAGVALRQAKQDEAAANGGLLHAEQQLTTARLASMAAVQQVRDDEVVLAQARGAMVTSNSALRQAELDLGNARGQTGLYTNQEVGATARLASMTDTMIGKRNLAASATTHYHAAVQALAGAHTQEAAGAARVSQAMGRVALEQDRATANAAANANANRGWLQSLLDVGRSMVDNVDTMTLQIGVFTANIGAAEQLGHALDVLGQNHASVAAKAKAQADIEKILAADLRMSTTEVQKAGLAWQKTSIGIIESLAALKDALNAQWQQITQSTHQAFGTTAQLMISSAKKGAQGFLAEVQKLSTAVPAAIRAIKLPPITIPANLVIDIKVPPRDVKPLDKTPEAGMAAMLPQEKALFDGFITSWRGLQGEFKTALGTYITDQKRAIMDAHNVLITKLNAEDLRHEQRLQAIHDSLHQKIADAFRTAQQNRQSADQAYQARISQLNTENAQRIQNYMSQLALALQSHAQGFQAQVAAIQARNDQYLQNYRTMNDSIITKYKALLEKNVGNLDKHQIDLIKRQEAAAIKANDDRYRKEISAGDRQVIALSKAYQEYDARQQQQMTLWLVKNDEAFRRQIAQTDGVYQKHVHGIQTTLDRAVIKADQQAKAAQAREAEIHAAHIAGLQAAFNSHVARITKAMHDAAVGGGIWDTLKKQIDDLANNSLKKLALAFLTGKGNIDKLTKSAEAAAKAQDKMDKALARATDAITKEAIKRGDVVKSMENEKKMLDTQVTKAMAQYAHDLLHHTGSLAKDTAALDRAANAQAKYDAALQTAQDRVDAAQNKHKKVIDQVTAAYDRMKSKIDTGFAHAFDQLVLDLMKNSRPNPADVAALNKSIDQQAKFNLANAKATQMVTDRELYLAKKSGDLATVFELTKTVADTKLKTALSAAAQEFLQTGKISGATRKSLQTLQAQVDRNAAAEKAAADAAAQASTGLKALKDAAEQQATKALDDYARALYDQSIHVYHSAVELDHLKQAAIDAALGAAKMAAAEDRAKQAIDAVTAAQNMDFKSALSVAQANYDAALSAYQYAIANGVTGAALDALRQKAVDTGVMLQNLKNIGDAAAQAIQQLVDAITGSDTGLGKSSSDQPTPYQQQELQMQQQRLDMQAQQNQIKDQLAQQKFDAQQQLAQEKLDLAASKQNTKAVQDQTAILQQNVARLEQIIGILQKQLYFQALGLRRSDSVNSLSSINYLRQWAGQTYQNQGLPT